jgi:hypothetical protein
MQAEMTKLKAELSRTTEERDILKKAATYFAKQSGLSTRSYKSIVRNSDSLAYAASSKFIALAITHGCMNPYRLGPRRTKP